MVVSMTAMHQGSGNYAQNTFKEIFSVVSSNGSILYKAFHKNSQSSLRWLQVEKEEKVIYDPAMILPGPVIHYY